jgi:hypothetical protein
MECIDVALCIEKGTRTVVTGTCSAAAPTCPQPAQCSTSSKRCVKGGLARRYRAACGCDLAADDGGGLWALGGAALFAFGCVRRVRAAPAV